MKDGRESVSQELFVVATPIGNLADMTYRAVELLKTVDVILAEDTRTTGILLKHYDIQKPMLAYHSANEYRFDFDRLFSQYQKIALVSENGTPCLSDPGHSVVSKCYELGIRVTPIPGPSAVTALLSVCGFSLKTYLVYGFLPNKKGKRKNILTELLQKEQKIIVFYESPYRLVHLLELLAEANPELPVVVGREITKRFEEILRKNAKAMWEYYDNRNVKGELVVIIDNRGENSYNDQDDLEESDTDETKAVNFDPKEDDTF